MLITSELAAIYKGMIGIFKSNSIRSRLLSGFLALTLLIGLLALVSFYILQRTKRITKIRQEIYELQVLTLQLIKNDNDFLDFEVSQEHYYKTHESKYLTKHNALIDSIQNRTNIIPLHNYRKEVRINQSLLDIKSTLIDYNKQFRILDSLQMTRGFKDYGVEGQMRLNAHELETYWAPTAPDRMILLLTLRRHEKDFFIRRSMEYVKSFNSVATQIMNKSIDTPSQIRLIHYMDHFNHLVHLDTLIGLESGLGVRNELNKLSSKLNDDYTSLASYSDVTATEVENQAIVFFGLIITGVIAFSLISGVWFSKKISAPIAKLSKAIKKSLMTSMYKKLPISSLQPNAANEVRDLAESFNQLMNQVNQQLVELESKSRLVKKKNLSLKRVNHELDNFLYSVAHDIRAPLSSLLGLINIIRYENKQPEIENYLMMMEGSINRLEHFIKQVVRYAKNKNVASQPELIDLEEMVTELFNDHKFIDGADRIRQEVFIESNAMFKSDKMRLRIILTNLISNSIRYADFAKTTPYLKIIGNVNQKEAVLTISDNGLGIEKKDLDRIFDMFFRANQRSKGSGLGLFIFKKTLMKLKGKVEVSSELNEGTIFTIRIPNNLPVSLSAPQELMMHH